MPTSSRITATFDALKKQQRTGLITFVTAGDPTPAVTVPLLHALVDAGADILELGVPFSDPMAEGPVIQRACERALKFNIGLHDVLNMVREFRQTDQSTPVVLMGYANPIEAMGVTAFVEAADAAGADGTIVVDYPPEECEQMASLMKARHMSPIFLLAPTSTAARIGQVAALSSGFTYYVSLKGVTGAATIDTAEVALRIAEIRKQVTLPVAVGFGIRNAETAVEIAKVADAVVIGSQLIAEMERIPAGAGQAEAAIAAAAAFLAPIRAALDSQPGLSGRSSKV